MPQGNNPAEDKSSAENRIKNEGAGRTEQNDAVKKAFEDVQKLKEQIEQLKAQAQKIYETPVTPAEETAKDNRVASRTEKVIDNGREAGRQRRDPGRRARP